MTETVTDANGTTSPVSIKDATGEAMLFVPVAVHIDQVPLMVYFHGHSNNDKKHHNSLSEYIGFMSVRDLRPGLKSKKVMLLEPWGGTYSKFGAPASSSGLAALIEAALGKGTRPGSLILAGFSGGGDALRVAGMGLSGTWFSLISEVWCLDCMYSGEGKAWGDWARKTRKKLRVGLSSGENSRKGRGPRSQVDSIGTGDSISIENFTCEHEELPGLCIEKWL